MASLTMMASFAGVAAAAPSPSRRGSSFAVARAAAKVERCQQEPARLAAAGEEGNAEGRRAVMLAAAAACVAAIGGGAGAAMAGPKNGSPEAKKKYAPICVTMPTAKVCHN
ncbi:unnamed protein product [Urochloa humidicola]